MSDDVTRWGTPVETGTFAEGQAPTTVSFPAKPGRYLRFVALSEVSGKAYTAVAELDVAGAPL